MNKTGESFLRAIEVHVYYDRSLWGDLSDPRDLSNWVLATSSEESDTRLRGTPVPSHGMLKEWGKLPAQARAYFLDRARIGSVMPEDFRKEW